MKHHKCVLSACWETFSEHQTQTVRALSTHCVYGYIYNHVDAVCIICTFSLKLLPDMSDFSANFLDLNFKFQTKFCRTAFDLAA